MWWHPIQHWLAIHTGTINEPGPYYGFWSGFGSDIAEVAIVGGLVSIFRRHNCHQRWCWRLGHHTLTDPATGLAHLLCRRHHPAHPGRPLNAAAIATVSRRKDGHG